MSLSEKLEFIANLNPDATIKGMRSIGDAADEHLGKAQSKLDQTAGSMVKYGAGMVGAAVVVGGGLFELSKKWEEAALTAGQMADATGLTSEQASRWAVVARGADIDTATLEKSIGFMNKTAGKSPQTFADLGVALKDSNGHALDTNQIFLNTINVLNGIDDPQKRAAEGAKLLGKGWMSMAELVGEGSDKLKTDLASVSSAQVFSQQQVDDAKNYRASLKELSNAVQGLVMELGRGAAPVLGEVAKVVATMVGGFSKLNDLTGGTVGKLAAVAAVAIGLGGALSVVTGKAILMREALTTVGDDGERSFKQISGGSALAGTAMIAGAVAMYQYNAAQEATAARARALAQDLKDVSTATDNQALKDYGEALSKSWSVGKNLDDVNKDLATTNIEGAKRVLDLAKANGFGANVIDSLTTAIKNAQLATAQGSATQQKYAENVDGTTDATGGATSATQKLTAAQQQSIIAAELADRTQSAAGVTAEYQTRVTMAQTQQLADQAKQVDLTEAAFAAINKMQQDYVASQTAAINTGRSYDEQVVNNRIALEAYNKEVEHGKLKGDALTAATSAMADQFIATATTFSTATGATANSQAANDRLVWSLTQTMNTLDPNNPLRANLQGYIDQLNSVPNSVSTSVDTTYHAGGVTRHAKGGRASGPSIINDQGGRGELVNLPDGSTVVPADQTDRLMAGYAGSGGGGGVTVIVNVAGSVVSENNLIDAVHLGLARKQARVGTLGLNR